MESYSSYLVTLLPTHTRKDYLNLNNHTEMIGKKEKKIKVTKIRCKKCWLTLLHCWPWKQWYENGWQQWLGQYNCNFSVIHSNYLRIILFDRLAGSNWFSSRMIIVIQRRLFNNGPFPASFLLLFSSISRHSDK